MANPSPHRGSVALTLAVWASTIAIVIVTGRAIRTLPPSASIAAAERAPALWLARDAIHDAHLPDLRRPYWPEHRDTVERFYANRGFTPAWTRKGRPTQSAHAAIDVLERARDRGLEPEDYDAGRWTARVSALRHGRVTERDRARFDLALTVSVLRYASDLAHGRVGQHRPGARLAAVTAATPTLDLAEVLEQLAADSPARVADRLASLEPPDPQYRRLLDVLRRYRELQRSETTAPAPLDDDEVIRPGDRVADLRRLVELLTRLGDLERAHPIVRRVRRSRAEDVMLYDAEVVDAVKRFQRRHGLVPDGEIGAGTLRRLSIPLERRVRQIELALERWRSTPRQLERPVIVVNLPEFRLRAFDEAGQVAFTTKVVVGRAGGHQTPLFADRMRTVVFRPSWYVPASLARREIVPELEKDPERLAREGYQILGASGRDLDPDILADLRSGALRLRQRPGPGNALGPVKFVFPNRWNVYLHGTPKTSGFARARRDLSHGCIRVADPIGLAEWVLRDHPDWDRKRILDAVALDQRERAVTLDAPLSVQLAYHTVVVDENGEVLFLDDLYGHDARLERALRRRHAAGAGRTLQIAAAY
jgi:murein L,D-transpeptidase YcbB/YkuD